MRRIAAIASLALLAAAPVTVPAGAQMPPGDVEAGQSLARQWCSSCHVISRGEPRRVIEAVPSFPSIADNPAVTEMRLRVFLQTPHERMPNLMLSRAQIDDVISYILSMKR